MGFTTSLRIPVIFWSWAASVIILGLASHMVWWYNTKPFHGHPPGAPSWAAFGTSLGCIFTLGFSVQIVFDYFIRYGPKSTVAWDLFWFLAAWSLWIAYFSYTEVKACQTVEEEKYAPCKQIRISMGMAFYTFFFCMLYWFSLLISAILAAGNTAGTIWLQPVVTAEFTPSEPVNNPVRRKEDA